MLTQIPGSSVRFIPSSVYVFGLIHARSSRGLESGNDYHRGLGSPFNEHFCLPKTLQGKSCTHKLKGVF